MARALVVILTVVLALAATDAVAYRDLAACPDLEPLGPTAPVSPAAERCQTAVERAMRRFVRRSLHAHHACLRRVQGGTIADDPVVACLGSTALSTAAYTPPSDGRTAERLGAAAAEAGAALRRACPDPVVATIGGCAPTAGGLAECVLADQREHVAHLVRAAAGELRPTTERARLRCQSAILRASAASVAQASGAIARCLARRANGAPGETAVACLGAVRSHADVAPTDPRTRARLGRIGRRLSAAPTACSDDAIAALDACSSDRAGLAACLACSHRREILLLAQGRRGGEPVRPSTAFVDWATLRNPVLGFEDRMVKNQSIVFHDGAFWIFTGQRYEPDFSGPYERAAFRTPDFRSYETLADPDLTVTGGDLARLDGVWHLASNGPRPDPASGNDIHVATSPDLLAWTPRTNVTVGLWPNSIIDGALVREAGFVFLVFKDRALQLPYVTRSTGAALDGTWLPPARAIAGFADPFYGFAEAFHFLRIEGVLRVVGTGRDLELVRCGHPVYDVYTCSHEPFIYSLRGVTADLATWTTWTHRTQLRVPYESWNTFMHANSGHLADWREHDGFFYLSYSGSLDGTRFELRGHGKLGLARSRDLVHWRVPGDLRD